MLSGIIYELYVSQDSSGIGTELIVSYSVSFRTLVDVLYSVQFVNIHFFHCSYNLFYQHFSSEVNPAEYPLCP